MAFMSFLQGFSRVSPWHALVLSLELAVSLAVSLAVPLAVVLYLSRKL